MGKLSSKGTEWQTEICTQFFVTLFTLPPPPNCLSASFVFFFSLFIFLHPHCHCPFSAIFLCSFTTKFSYPKPFKSHPLRLAISQRPCVPAMWTSSCATAMSEDRCSGSMVPTHLHFCPPVCPVLLWLILLSGHHIHYAHFPLPTCQTLHPVRQSLLPSLLTQQVHRRACFFPNVWLLPVPSQGHQPCLSSNPKALVLPFVLNDLKLTILMARQFRKVESGK